MRLLLDTHILLWWLADDPALPGRAADVVADPSTEVLVSAATAWEIAIKRAAGRLEAPDNLLDALDASGFGTLAITAFHTIAAGNLPPHHADPFDRMLVAQARAEELTLVSVDTRIAAYDVGVLALSA